MNILYIKLENERLILHAKWENELEYMRKRDSSKMMFYMIIAIMFIWVKADTPEILHIL
jgi:hypothetical protein